MIRDIFVPFKTKKLFSRRPPSPAKFIRIFEDVAGIKIDKDIRRAFKRVFPNSYTSPRRVVHIFGGRCSGKTTLCEMIVLYDALKNSCTRYPGGQFEICTLANTLGNNTLFQQLKAHVWRMISSIYVHVYGVTPGTSSDMRGMNSGSFADDGAFMEPYGSDVIQLKFMAFDKFMGNQSSYHGLPHYVVTCETGCYLEKTFIEQDNTRIKIYLQNRM